ncbi:MAG: DUF2281 domain-containing protein [Flavobacteriales bacterium]|nr:DUF2281 domain-containing protein [Flavobacteriales bacterium]
MNIDSVKVELIDWIAQLNDKNSINRILTLKKKLTPSGHRSEKRIFGSGKHLIEFIADDFDEPLDQFKDYTK